MLSVTFVTSTCHILMCEACAPKLLIIFELQSFTWKNLELLEDDNIKEYFEIRYKVDYLEYLVL